MKRVLIAKNQAVTRCVCLPAPGNLKVRAGETVDFGTVIAELSQPERFEMIDIPSHFKVSPEQAEGMVKRLVGDVLAKGDVLAQKDGFITQLFRSPGSGKVVSLREGRITLAIGMQKRQLLSPVPGIVAELLDGCGAKIALNGSVIEAVWANGKSAKGELVFWDELEKKGLGIASASVKDKIVAFKKTASGGQIRRLLRLKPAGVVLPSVSVKQLKVLDECDTAVLSFLGFGEANMDALSLAMLETMLEKTVYLLGETSSNGPKENPILIMPEAKLPDLGLGKEEVKLEPGVKVRLRGKPYTGMVGIVQALPEEPAVFASGIKSKVVVVECEDQQVINASVHNIDLIQE